MVKPRSYSFYVYGHPNTRCTHKTTLEFTKDSNITPRGNCILGVKASFKPDKLTRFIEENKKAPLFRVYIGGGKRKTEIIGKLNPDFRADNEIVLRKSDFKSKRTLLVKCNKAAEDIEKKVINKIRCPEKKLKIRIEPVFPKAIIFDFDDTLEDFRHAHKKTIEELAEVFNKRYSINNKEFIKVFYSTDKYFSWKGYSIRNLDRHNWFRRVAKELKIKLPNKEIEQLVVLYWNLVYKYARPIKGARQLIRWLNKRYKLIILSDSDFGKSIKIKRIDKVIGKDFFRLIVTGDDIKRNKPSYKAYEYIKKHTGINFKTTIAIGDRPPKDLSVAKKLGMITIWINRFKNNDNYKFVDYSVKELDEIKQILN